MFKFFQKNLEMFSKRVALMGVLLLGSSLVSFAYGEQTPPDPSNSGGNCHTCVKVGTLPPPPPPERRPCPICVLP